MIYRGPREIGHDPAMFSPLYLIPPGLETYVKPAYERFLGLKQLFENELDSAKEKDIRVVLYDPNPLLASMAFRRLVESDKIGDAEVAGILPKASDYQMSVRTFLWLSAKSKSVPTGARPSGPVMEAIAKVKGRKDLEFLALGAYAAARWSDASLKLSQDVLAVVMQALDKHPDPLDAAARQRWETLKCVVRELGEHSKPRDPSEGGMRTDSQRWHGS
jgi:hypothetical protein